MEFDLGILRGRIIDGAGNPWHIGDLGIVGRRIAKVGRVDRNDCVRAIEAKGMYVCPGFVDIHTHSDISAMTFRGCDSTLRQGVTTHLAGNCGQGIAPLREPHVELMKTYWGEWAGKAIDTTWRTFGEYLEALGKGGLGHNVGLLVAHGAVRTAAMGPKREAPSDDELDVMKDLVDEAMGAGAFGMSTGLVYPPSCFGETKEIIELCKVVARYGGMYASHIRGERETIIEAIKEAILIGEKSGVRVQISHNCPKIGSSGRTSETLGLVKEARGLGLDVTIDNDVHTDLAPQLSGALPQHLGELPTNKIVEHLRSAENRKRIKDEIIEDRLPAFGPSGLLKHGRFDRIFILHSPNRTDLIGKTVQQIANDRRQDPFDTYFDLIVEDEDKLVAIFDYIEEEDIRALMKNENMMFSSDGATLSLSGPMSDPTEYFPCAFGEYPGILERYVRDEPILPLQDAIRRMTSFPAQKIGLFDRGLLRPGMVADIAVIDLPRVRDKATNRWPHEHPYENYPHDYPEGIPYVIVNGSVAVDDGEQTSVRAGEVLRHSYS
ncbi:MAG: amidohydrolase family protein [Methanobacteriota archaeon]|nr:MAG: amidohydrolase family protein [Euryarchaeota archaeon]